MSLHGLGPIQIGTTVLGGITTQADGLNNEVRGEPSSGELYSRVQVLAGQKFRPTFTTTDIGAALALCGTTGTAISSTASLKMFARKYATGGTRAASGHVGFTYQLGLLVPKSLDCNHQGDATLSYEAIILWDGTNDPVVVSTNATVPSVASESRWTLGAVTLGGVSIPQIKSIKVDFGIKAEPEGSGSALWDSEVGISEIAPKITPGTSDIDDLLPLLGDEGTFSAAFRERGDAGTFTGKTATLSGSGLALFEKHFSASGNKPGESSLIVHPKWDGTTDPMVITIGS
jgi:hypothetical protein